VYLAQRDDLTTEATNARTYRRYAPAAHRPADDSLGCCACSVEGLTVARARGSALYPMHRPGHAPGRWCFPSALPASWAYSQHTLLHLQSILIAYVVG